MADNILNLAKDDYELVWFLASTKPCSLEVKKGDKDNWIERAGGDLPNYVCVVAKGLMRSGHSRSASIAIAISRIKKWAAGGDGVKADTVAKAAKALAQWEALKAKHAAKKIIKASSHCVGDYLVLSEVDSYNFEMVRNAWDAQIRRYREAQRAIREASGVRQEVVEPYSWVKEIWTDFIIVELEHDRTTYKVSYVVENGEVEFSIPEEVEQKWISKETEWSSPVQR